MISWGFPYIKYYLRYFLKEPVEIQVLFVYSLMPSITQIDIFVSNVHLKKLLA